MTEFPLASKDLAARVAVLNAYRAQARGVELLKIDGNPFGVGVETFGGAIAVRYRHEAFRGQSRVFNPDLAGEAGFDAMVKFFRGVDAEMHAALTPFNFRPWLARKLVEASFVPVSFGVMLYGPCHVPREAAAKGVTIREIDGDAKSVAAYLDLFVEATDVPHSRREIVRKHERAEMRVPGMRCYVAEVDGEPAAVASMLVRERSALLIAAATAPRFKKAGCLGALLRKRLQDAAADRCEFVFSNTAPGSSAQSNHERAGMRILYTSVTWVDSTV